MYNADLEQCVNIANVERLFGKTFVITGARGMIARTMINALEKLNSTRNARIKIIGTTRETYNPCLSEGLPAETADFIIPLASNTHPLAYSQQPVETMLTNLLGAKHAMELAAKCGARVVYPSTVEIYGNANSAEQIFSEGDTGQLTLATARACYTESKRAAEAMCQSYAAEHKVDVVIGRLCRIFGPTVRPSDSKASSQFLRCAVNKQDIVLKSEGQQLFSYLYVADAVNALLHLAANGDSGQAYNIASDECNVRLAEFAQLCADVAGKNVVFDLPSEAERKGYSIASTALLDSSLLRATGWRSRYDIREAINRTIAQLENQVN